MRLAARHSIISASFPSIMLLVTTCACISASAKAQSKPNKSKPASSLSMIDSEGIKPGGEVEQGRFASIVGKINAQVAGEFKKAWEQAYSGYNELESVVLLYVTEDGSLLATLQPKTGKYRKTSFAWRASIKAIAHTHPNDTGKEPSDGDIKLADRFNVPMITMSSRGMFLYDPAAKKVIRLHQSLDWLKLARWEGKD